MAAVSLHALPGKGQERERGRERSEQGRATKIFGTCCGEQQTGKGKGRASEKEEGGVEQSCRIELSVVRKVAFYEGWQRVRQRGEMGVCRQVTAKSCKTHIKY